MSSDISAIKISTNSHAIPIINVSNDNTYNNSINTLARGWGAHGEAWTGRAHSQPGSLRLNRHHSTWEGTTNAHLTSTDRLLNPHLVRMHLEMSLPRGIPTLEARNTGNWTRPDNVWRCAGTLPTVIPCNVEPSLRPSQTEYLSITTTLDLIPTERSKGFNFRSIDWEEYDEKLKSILEQINRSLANLISTTNMLEQITDDLFEAIDKNKRSSTSRQNNPVHKTLVDQRADNAPQNQKQRKRKARQMARGPRLPVPRKVQNYQQQLRKRDRKSQSRSMGRMDRARQRP